MTGTGRYARPGMLRLLSLRREGLPRRWLVVTAVCVLAALTWVAQLYVWSTDSPASVPAGLAFVRTGAYLTRFQAWGTPSVEPVVLVHGAFESVTTWGPVASLLAPHHHVESYDLEGYGYTQRVGPYTTRSLASQLAAFLTARHLYHPVLVGHSLGAGVIARFVLDHPGSASGVVFLDGDGLSVTIPGSWVPGAIPEPIRSALFRGVVGNDALVSTIFGLACGPGCPTLTPDQTAGVRRPLQVAGAESAILELTGRPVVGVTAPELGRIRSAGLPALVVFGAEDPEYSSDAPARTATRIGAPSPTLIAGSGHLSLWSHPREVAAAVAAFTDRLAPGTGSVGHRSDPVQVDQGSSASASMS
jgi:pimeloyl-ACP methyl ester carboxylesterase